MLRLTSLFRILAQKQTNPNTIPPKPNESAPKVAPGPNANLPLPNQIYKSARIKVSLQLPLVAKGILFFISERSVRLIT